ncbi:MAG: phosphoribosylamine--glycine ligase [bacterium]|nr:phosphoribosylamine--glycine ligase [bacterium]
MNVMVIGGGGREHALAWKLKQSPRVERVYCVPGNAGMRKICEVVPVGMQDFKGLAAFAKAHEVGLTVVGPEEPLCGGIVNVFQNAGLRIFGPSSAGAQLEGSKVFAKRFMERYGIPTARFEVFEDVEKAVEYVRKQGAPLVVKADGLAGGKGVSVCESVGEAEEAVRAMLERQVFGAAGRRILIEEYLDGEEASVLALTDGKAIVALEPAQDHKRVYDNDQGPNTGGMGAYSPAPVVTPRVMRVIEEKVLQRFLLGIQREKIDYRGVIYAGLMIKGEEVRVLEFNVRFGDPEAQAILPRLRSDLSEVCMATVEGRLSGVKLVWDARPAVCVVMASGGYPGAYHKHLPITGLEEAERMADVVVFHAGTEEVKGALVTNGGRVLGVTALGRTMAEAVERAYEAVERIHFEHAHFRWDIGAKAVR